MLAVATATWIGGGIFAAGALWLAGMWVWNRTPAAQSAPAKQAEPRAWSSDDGPTPEATAYLAAMAKVESTPDEFKAAVLAGHSPFEFATGGKP
jgi:hypothetical protein